MICSVDDLIILTHVRNKHTVTPIYADRHQTTLLLGMLYPDPTVYTWHNNGCLLSKLWSLLTLIYRIQIIIYTDIH